MRKNGRHNLMNNASDVGSRLDDIGIRLSRGELLESLLDHADRIAEGFGDVDSASVMPPIGVLITQAEIRDVLEYSSA